MAPRKKGPLQTVQKETDDIKKRVDALVRDVNRLGVSEGTESLQRCSELQNTVTATLERLKKLTKAEESAPIGNYEQLKRDEEERLRAQQDRLKALAQKLQPEDNSTEGEEDSAEEDSEEEDESQEEDEEDDVHNDKTKEDAADDEVDETAQNYTARKGIRTYVALSDFTGEEEGDLTVQKGAVLRVLQKNEDGWWLAQDAKGNKGLVPRNYLKVISPHDQGQDTEEEESDEEQGDGKKIAEDKQRTLQNWDTIRRAVTEIDATDVLSAMGAIPPGFRTSTLSRLLEEGTSYRASHYIQPRLSQSELCFKDLQMDPDTGKVHSRSSRVCLTVTLWSCRMIPPPGVGLQVLSRHIRFCAFNGTEVLSNIHTVRATYNPTSPKTWSFSPRMSNMLPCLLDGDCFIRCDSDSPELGILFELGITYIRNSTGERGDLSCGWAFLKLFDENGALIPLRTYELTVHGGTPYEAEADADATSTKRGTSTGVLQQMLLSRKLPKLIVKLKPPKTRVREQLNLLPDTITGCLSTVHLLSLYRQLLADALLLDRVTMQNADLICNAVLATFPGVLDQSDLMDAFRKLWTESESNLKRSEKKDITVLKKHFESVYMSGVFPLLHSAEMPVYFWADENTENQRARLIYSPEHKISRETMLSSSHTHQAFDISQVSYDLLTSAWL
ncbi:nephrocystin-1 [Astyanax mexicanus]|uniref:nephrocystin-1 n=1 Tax=Astyanax mexicanus TaxID=7994 RepID=UPI0020CAAEFF|nr:nephrocystin-1 [Astyanax mexicanus]